MEVSVDYYHQIEENAYIAVTTPLIPVKYYLRTFTDKEIGYDRVIIYFRWAGKWRVRLHMDVEELIAFRRRIDAFIQKKIKEGHLEVK